MGMNVCVKSAIVCIDGGEEYLHTGSNHRYGLFGVHIQHMKRYWGYDECVSVGLCTC